MQYQNLGILQKGKIPKFWYKQQQSWLHSYANEEQTMGAIFYSACVFVDLQGGGKNTFLILGNSYNMFG